MSVIYKPGDVVGGRYRIEDMVGTGGAGVVYRAKDETSGVRVAVKVVNAKLVQTQEDKRLFGRHLAQARRLDHQNVVQVLDEGVEEGRPFFVMPFLDGLSLRKIIDLRRDKGQVFSPSEVEPIIEQLTRALELAHSQGVVHGNVKPDNVIVLPDLLKLTDFGLLPGLPRKPFLAIQKQRGASFRYLSPEVRAEAASLGPVADVYSLGVVLGEMLTGLVHDDTKPDLLRRACSNLPVAAQSAVLRAVARSAHDRPSKASDILAQLRGQVPLHHRPSADTRSPRQEEAPTQRVDIHEHGLPDIHIEGTGSFAVEDEMIESAAPARRDPRTVLREEGRTIPPPRRLRAAATPAPELLEAARSATLSLGSDEEEATEAALDAMEAFGALEEISGSSLDILEEPGLVIVPPEERARIDAQHTIAPTAHPEPLPEPSRAAAGSMPRPNGAKATLPRVPLESEEVLPSTPFVEAGDTTAVERRPGGEAPSLSNGLHLESAGADLSAPALAKGPRRGGDASTTSVMARPAKRERPMTRPRVSTVGSGALPSASSPAVPAASLPSDNRRWVALVAGLSAFALVLMGLVFYLVWDNSRMIASQNQVIEKLLARERAARAAVVEADTEASEAEAKAVAAEAEATKLEAQNKREAEALAAAEAERLAAEEAAKRAADVAAKQEAESRAEKARVEAAKRKEAQEAAQKEADQARARAERERAAKEEANRKAAEARAAQAAAARERRAVEDQADSKRPVRAEPEPAVPVPSRPEPVAVRRPVVARKAPEAPKAATSISEGPTYERSIAPREEAEAAARVAPPKEEPLECPRGMTLVAAGAFMVGAPRNDPERNFGDQNYRSIEVEAFCVDYYEYPNGRGRTPSTGVSWATAAARCKKRGKRLCTEEEWEKACKGPGGSRYPYANAWDAERCNTEDEEGTDREVVGSGTFRTCRSGYNVFDMGGNVAEWTSTKKGSAYVIKGGSSDRPGYDSRCASRKTRSGASPRDNLGFRCCAQPK